jgi:hypothetical protein
MTFKTKAQERAHKKVRKYIKEAFGDEVFREVSDRPAFFGVQGSALINIYTRPWGRDDAIIGVISCCVRDIEKPPDLLEYLLKENYSFRFGAFSLDKDGDICFEHAITGTSLDKNELVASVKMVATIADQYDDTIIRRWGGISGLDKLKQDIMDRED